MQIREYLSLSPEEQPPLSVWCQNIPAHSFRSVQKKLYSLCEKEGYSYGRTVNRWKPEELDIIHKYIGKSKKERGTIQDLAELLPDHTYRSIKLKVQEEKKKAL